MPRREDIEAAIAAYNSTNQRTVLLPPEAARLLAVMFSQSDVCQRSAADLAAAGLDSRTVRALLRTLIDAGFLSRSAPRRGYYTVYRLHLTPVPPPPRRQP